MAANVIQGKNLKEQIEILSDVGLQPSEVVEITGKTPNLIRVTKRRSKKK